MMLQVVLFLYFDFVCFSYQNPQPSVSRDWNAKLSSTEIDYLDYRQSISTVDKLKSEKPVANHKK